MMLRHSHTQADSRRTLWVAVALALMASAAYALIAQHLLATGDLAPNEQSASIVNFTAASYFVGGVLILLRYRWLWLFGAIVNAIVILFFFHLYANRPTVIFSPGGLATKAVEIMLEVVLISLLITRWRRAE